MDGAREIGFACHAVRCDPDALPRIPAPAIAHVTRRNAGHFVVVTAATASEVAVMDPADGSRRAIPRASFCKEWNGILLLLAPAHAFSAALGRSRRRSHLLRLTATHARSIAAMTGACVAATVLGFSSAIFLQRVVDRALAARSMQASSGLLIGVCLAGLLQLALTALRAILSLRVGRRIDDGLVMRYYKHLLRLPQRFFDGMRTGELTSRMTDVVKVRTFVADVAVDIQVNAVVVAAGSCVLFSYDWRLGAVTLMAIPLFAVVGLAGNARNRRAQSTTLRCADDVEAHVVESLATISTIRRLGMEASVAQTMEQRFRRLLDATQRAGFNALCFGLSGQLIARAYTVAVLWIGARLMFSGALTTGRMISCYALATCLAAPMMALVAAHKTFHDASVAADRLWDILELDTEDTRPSATSVPSPLADIAVDRVTFAYGGGPPALDDVCMRFCPGTLTAIVGESGSGKTTVAALLQRLYAPQSGHVRIGDVDLQQVGLATLRKHVTVVPQRVDLLSGSLLENICPGTSSPDMGRVLELCRELGIDAIAARMPGGLHGRVTELGANLSGGERQRIAIARALYANPSVIIFDEATASLDPGSERRVHACMARLRSEGRTLIAITHRLTATASADQIIVMHRARVVERGTHAELLALGGTYARMWAQPADCQDVARRSA